MTNHCPNRKGCTPSGSILKNFYFSTILVHMYSEWSITEFKENSTCEWCTILIFWPIVYLHMTNHWPNSQSCTPSGSISKIFYFTTILVPMYSEWAKTEFKENSTCEWCTTLVLWPIVYFHMTNHCPNSQGCTPSGSILINFYISLILVSMYSEWYKTEFYQHTICEWCTTLAFWPIIYLHMTNHFPNRQDCTPSGSILKNFYFSTILVPLYSEWYKTEF